MQDTLLIHRIQWVKKQPTSQADEQSKVSFLKTTEKNILN